MRGTDWANTTAPDNAGITAIKARTDNLPASPASTTDVQVTVTPTINPTELSSESVTAIQSGLATQQGVTDAQTAIIEALDTLEVTASVDTGEIVSGILDAGVSITVTSPYDPTEQTLTIVQRADYVDAGVSRPLRFTIEKEGVTAGDTVRFGAKLLRGATLLASLVKSGTIVESGENLVAEIELTREETDLTDSEDWRFELEHIDGGGNVTPLIVDQQMIVLPSRADAAE
jgi:hypothetical protein